MSRHEGQFEQFKHADHTVTLCYDSDCPSPRDNDGNLCTMACWHRRCDLGDIQLDPEKHGANLDKREEFIKWAEQDGDKVLACVPIWIYQHSGIHLHAQAQKPGYPYNCPWDSGQVGWAYVLKSKADAAGCEPGKSWTPEGGETITYDEARYEHEISQEVELYDRWQRGEFAGYIVEDKDGDTVDSCWGFDDVDYCRKEAKSAAEHAQSADAEARKRFSKRDWRRAVKNYKTELGYEAWLKECERALHEGRKTGT